MSVCLFYLCRFTMASTLFALLDDIASVLDDIALLAKAAARQSVGVVGDDLALNAQQLTGLAARRELPVVWAVARGSLRNKALLVPLALLLSALLPWAIPPLLMLGGAYLCFEGAEKLAHHVLPAAVTDGNVAMEEAAAPATPAALFDHAVHQLEAQRIQGAIRTDFVLSAEIIVIALGGVQDAAWLTQLGVLVLVALLLTAGVYGLVAVIVKLDDLGLYLCQGSASGGRTSVGLWRCARAGVGRSLLWLAPWVLRVLAVVGTAAMFMVGGGIVLHGLPVLQPLATALAAFWADSPVASTAASVLNQASRLALELLVGLGVGVLVFISVRLGQRGRKWLKWLW